MKDFRKFPQRPNAKPMGVNDHIRKANQYLNNWPDPEAEDLLHDLFVGMYPKKESQNC